MSEDTNKNVDALSLSLDDLDDVTGGTVIRYARHNRTHVREFTCPQCGSQNLEGIQEGARFADLADAVSNTKHATVKCLNCGYTGEGYTFKQKVWSEKA
jgi:predicted nucleic-acid-binding Zn-ribbon protein